jgi:hypothetical protein
MSPAAEQAARQRASQRRALEHLESQTRQVKKARLAAAHDTVRDTKWRQSGVCWALCAASAPRPYPKSRQSWQKRQSRDPCVGRSQQI